MVDEALKSGLFERALPGASQRRQRLEPRNRQDPGRSGGAPLEPAGVAPDVQKHVGGQVFSVAWLRTRRSTKRKTFTRWRVNRVSLRRGAHARPPRVTC